MKHIFREKPHAPIFKKYLIAYLVAFIICLTFSILINNDALKAFESHIKTNAETLSVSLLNKIDIQLSDIENYVIDLSMNASLRQFLTTSGYKNDGIDVIRLQEIIQQIPSWDSYSDLIDATYIYCSNINALITEGTAYLRPETMYSHLFGATNLDYQEWSAGFFNVSRFCSYGRSDGNIVNHQKADRNYLIHSIIDYTSRKLIGQIIVFFRADTLVNDLNLLDNSGISYLRIDTKDGFSFVEWNTSQSMSKPDNTDLKNDTVLYNTITSDNRLSCTYGISQAMISLALNGIKRRTVAFLCFMALLGIFASTLFADRMSRPYGRILAKLRGDSSPGSIGLEPLDKEISVFLEHNAKLKQEQTKQKNILENAFFNRLVYGSFINRREMDQLAQYVQYDLDGKKYIGLVIELCCESDEIAIPGLNNLLDEHLQEIQNICPVTIPLSPRRRAALYIIRDDRNLDDVFSELTQLYQSLLLSFGLETRYYLGEETENLQDVQNSFKAAIHLADYIEHQDQQYIITYSHSVKWDTSYKFSKEDQYLLIQSVRNGESDQLNECLDRIWNDNVNTLGLGVFQTQLLINTLISLLNDTAHDLINLPANIAEQQQLTDLFSKLPYQKPSESFKMLKEGFDLLCSLAKIKMNYHNTEFAQKAKGYIEDHFREESISILSVGLALGVNERFISSVYKNQYGISINNYVAKLRVEEANRLMKETDLPITTISSQVGYTNMNSFRNAYKREMGCNPSEYQRK